MLHQHRTRAWDEPLSAAPARVLPPRCRGRLRPGPRGGLLRTVLAGGARRRTHLPLRCFAPPVLEVPAFALDSVAWETASPVFCTALAAAMPAATGAAAAPAAAAPAEPAVPVALAPAVPLAPPAAGDGPAGAEPDPLFRAAGGREESEPKPRPERARWEAPCGIAAPIAAIPSAPPLLPPEEDIEPRTGLRNPMSTGRANTEATIIISPAANWISPLPESSHTPVVDILIANP